MFWTLKLRWAKAVRADAPGTILDRLDSQFATMDQAWRAGDFVASWAGIARNRIVVVPNFQDDAAAGNRCRHSIHCRHAQD